MPDSTTPSTAAPTPDVDRAAEDLALRSLEALESQTTSTFQSANNFNDLLRIATRHIRRLVDCEVARIWVTRSGGRRLVAREFPGDREGVPIERRMARAEGLAGWSVANEQPLRLAPGDKPPALQGETPEFTSALVMPLFRRGDAFGAIECLNKRGGGAFTDADFDRLDVAAEHVAFALDNALLYEETERRALEKEMLLEVSKSLSAVLELDELIEVIFKTLRQVVNYDAAAIYLVNRTTQALEMVREIGYPRGSEAAFSLQVGQGIVGWVAKTGQSLIVPDVRSDARYVAARPETRSELATPLVRKDRAIGVFNLESDYPDAYHEGHLELVTAFAAQAAVAIERARLMRDQLERRRYEKELAIAREIQESFLPKAAPSIPHFDMAGATHPHDLVGGDYYDFVRVTETRIGLAIADVSGKGVPAALIMAGFRMSLLGEIRNEFAIRAVMRKVNSLLYESMDRDKFVTAFYGVLDTKSQVLTFSNAGHNPPTLLRAGGKVEYLEEGGVALGVLPDARYEDRPIALQPGDLLVLYTDGISEAENPEGKLFGTRRLEEAMARLREGSARQILDGIVAEVQAWAGERGPTDDLTLIVLKALPQ
jgi:sigma-B regulation protein RsbU (phosphoserine phosphatase)